MNRIIIFLIFCTFQYVTADLKSLDQASTIHVSLLYRHGERTPNWHLKNDLYKDAKYWPEGFGQLTNQGLLHHYQLGQWLRSRYLNLIPNGVFRTSTMCTLSTAFDRTIMSAQANLAGMFPILENDTFTDLKWKPIPVYMTQLNSDKLLAMDYVPCKNYEKELKGFKNSDEFKKLDEKYTNLYKILTEKTGQNIGDPEDFQNIYSLLLVYEMSGLKLPEWSQNIYPDLLREGSDYSFTIPAYTTKMKRLRSGPLLKNIIQTFEEKINNTLSRKQKCSNITAYSAHDDVVANFLNTLGVFDGKTPPFAALVAIELRKSDRYYVNVLYKNSTDPFANPAVLQIPNCEILCPFEDFKKLVDPVIPQDWDQECNI